MTLDVHTFSMNFSTIKYFILAIRRLSKRNAKIKTISYLCSHLVFMCCNRTQISGIWTRRRLSYRYEIGRPFFSNQTSKMTTTEDDLIAIYKWHPNLHWTVSRLMMPIKASTHFISSCPLHGRRIWRLGEQNARWIFISCVNSNWEGTNKWICH